MLKELVDVFSKPLLIIYQHSWITREVTVDWRLVNVMLINRKSRKMDPENYKPVGLPWVPGKVMEQIILTAITWYVQDNQVIRSSHCAFMKVRFYFSKLISFYDKIKQWMRERLCMLFT